MGRGNLHFYRGGDLMFLHGGVYKSMVSMFERLVKRQASLMTGRSHGDVLRGL